MTAVSIVPVWRLREIRNLADVLSFYAAQCPLVRQLFIAESDYLKPNAHFRLWFCSHYEIGQANHYIQQIKGLSSPEGTPLDDVIIVHLYFNGDMSTNLRWRQTLSAIAKELAKILFFSQAARRPILVPSEKREKELTDLFVSEIVNRDPFLFEAAGRPRPMLSQIIELAKRMQPKADFLLDHMQRLLLPYLGPDGW